MTGKVWSGLLVQAWGNPQSRVLPLESICWMPCPLQPHHRNIFRDSKFLCGWNSPGGLPGGAVGAPNFPSLQSLPAVPWVLLASTSLGFGDHCFSTEQTALASFCLQPAASPAQR